MEFGTALKLSKYKFGATSSNFTTDPSIDIGIKGSLALTVTLQTGRKERLATHCYPLLPTTHYCSLLTTQSSPLTHFLGSLLDSSALLMTAKPQMCLGGKGNGEGVKQE